METSRLSRGIAWFHIGLGLAELTLPRLAHRLLGIPRRGGLVLACAGGRIATSVGLLSASDRRPWLWARLAGDLIDLSFLGPALQRRSSDFSGQLASTAAVLGMAVLDIQVLLKSSATPASDVAGRVTGTRRIADTMASGPMESWRGSGLAEDVGAPASAGGPAEEDPDREEKMREAQRQLGLPDPDAAGSRL